MRSRSRHSEAGFTVVELIVVVVIVMILFAMILPNIGTAHRSADGGSLVVGGASVWRAVNEHRADNRGVLPAPSALSGLAGGAPTDSFVSPAGSRYFREWPRAPRSGDRLPLVVGGAPPVPRTRPAGPAGLVYYRSANQMSGYVAGYDTTGRRVFCRGMSDAASTAWTNGTIVPNGGPC